MDMLIGFSLLMSVLLLVLFPLIFAQLMAASLVKLHLGPATAMLLVIGIVVGGFINIPVRRLSRTEDVLVYPFAAFGIARRWPRLQRSRRDTIIAVNLGGCVIPVALALYELAHLDAAMLPAVAVIAAINIVVCYLLAQPVAGADFLHLKAIAKLSTGVASIGGAGTFDAIVLSGIVAAYLA